MLQNQAHRQRADARNHLIQKDGTGIDHLPSADYCADIVVQKIDIHNYQSEVLHDNKQRIHLSVPVRMPFRCRLIKKRNQNHQRSDENHINEIEDEIHQNRP